jgi:hypothetical protein
MSRFDRTYLPGDEIQINQLYGRITGAYRSDEEYSWEWLYTWKGQASIWLAFEDDRPEDDQLIGQFSLIPTPLSFWGENILTGRTENCMSHPDYRGKGMYFYHEKKYFEEAKKIYKVFFTTAGHVARGAPGKVRQKLGYRPFDYWVTYSLWLDKGEMSKEVYSKLPKLLKKWELLGKTVSKVVSSFLFRLTGSSTPMNQNNFQDYGEEDASFGDIEKLWRENEYLYGISIDRTKEYMEWRIKNNPYVSHRFLCNYKDGKLLGYIIYTIQDGIVHLVDILVDRKDKVIFQELFDQLRHLSRSNGYKLMKCHTLSKNHFLVDQLREGKFLNYANLFARLKKDKHEQPMQFFVYISDEVKLKKDVWDNQNWYFTDLVKEGRPYTARLIG